MIQNYIEFLQLQLNILKKECGHFGTKRFAAYINLYINRLMICNYLCLWFYSLNRALLNKIMTTIGIYATCIKNLQNIILACQAYKMHAF